jgi:hypothetical protein
MKNGTLKKISYKEAVDFLLPKHYSGRTPSISYAFGWFIEERLVAVCSFGKPASNSLCEGVCGKELSPKVYELNRLCRVEDLNLQISEFVSSCLRELSKYDLIIVSYSDTGMNHNGYIYQACNFYFTGANKPRTDKWTEGNKHSRHYSNEKQGKIRKVRTAKNRYIFFAVSRKTIKKNYLKKLKYPIVEYPKAVNKNYVLGEYQKVALVERI